MSTKSAIKDLLFARFEQRRSEIIENRNKWQQQLDEKVHDFGEAFGREAVTSLGNIILSLHAGGHNKPSANSAPPQEDRVVTSGRKTRRRRRRSRKASGAPKVSWKEEIVKILKASKQPLTAEEIRAKLPPTASGKNFSGRGFQGCLTIGTYHGTLKKDEKKRYSVK